MITAELFFDDEGYTLKATFDIDSLAHAVGCPTQYAGSMHGQMSCAINSCVCVETGLEHSPSSFEYEMLEAEALKEVANRKRHYEPRSWED
jgi:hypothetical protein